jgi:hypothetical protein
MNEDWRSRNTLSGSDAMKVAVAIIALLFACILLAWVVTKTLRPAQPAPGAPAEKKAAPESQARP